MPAQSESNYIPPTPYPYETAEITVSFEDVPFSSPGVAISGEVDLAIEIGPTNKFRKITGIGEIRVSRMTSTGTKTPIIGAQRPKIIDDIRFDFIKNSSVIEFARNTVNNAATLDVAKPISFILESKLS